MRDSFILLDGNASIVPMIYEHSYVCSKVHMEAKQPKGQTAPVTNVLPLRLKSPLYCLACDNGAGPCKCFSLIRWYISLVQGAGGRASLLASCGLFYLLAPMVLYWCFSWHSQEHLSKQVPPVAQSWLSGDVAVPPCIASCLPILATSIFTIH